MPTYRQPLSARSGKMGTTPKRSGQACKTNSFDGQVSFSTPGRWTWGGSVLRPGYSSGYWDTWKPKPHKVCDHLSSLDWAPACRFFLGCRGLCQRSRMEWSSIPCRRAVRWYHTFPSSAHSLLPQLIASRNVDEPMPLSSVDWHTSRHALRIVSLVRCSRFAAVACRNG